MSEGTSRLRVFVATTSGPVEIQRITEEDPAIDSVVCLAGKAMPLPISAGYHNFVRQPTGVIQRLFGHASWRVDLSATVEDGYSWQLGLLLGHAAVAAGRFAGDVGRDAAAGQAVIATGEVKVDLEVLAVGHVAAKLDRLVPTVRELLQAGARVTIVVPAANRADVDEGRFAAAGLDPGRCRIVYAATAADAFAALDLDPPVAGRAARPPVPVAAAASTPGRRRAGAMLRLGIAAGATVCLLGIATWAAATAAFGDWRAMAREGRLAALDEALSAAARAGGLAGLKANLFERWLDHARPADAAVALRVVEYRAPEGRSCAAVRFGAAKATPQVVEKVSARALAPARFDGLCALEIVAEAAGEAVYLWGRYERRLADTADGPAEDTVILGPNRGLLRWKIDLPRRLDESFDMRVVVVAARQPLDGASGWLAAMVPPPGPPGNARDWYAKARRLNARGVTLIDTAYRLSP